MSKGKFILLMSDDDFASASLLVELCQFLSVNTSTSLLFLRLNFLGATPNKVTSPDSFRLLSWISMRAGSVSGITFDRKKYELSSGLLEFSDSIYPQVAWAISIYQQNSIQIPHFGGYINCSPGTSLIDRFSDAMHRPSDFGMVERSFYLSRCWMNNLFKKLDIAYAISDLCIWFIVKIFRISQVNPCLAVKCLFSFLFKVNHKILIYPIFFLTFVRQAVNIFYRFKRDLST